jgi:uncharacterized protein (DUF433 family)
MNRVETADFAPVALSSRAMRRPVDVVRCDAEILGGTPVFASTRVPVRSLFDYLEAGETLDEFLHQFPSLKREQAVAVLALAREALIARARRD